MFSSRSVHTNNVSATFPSLRRRPRLPAALAGAPHDDITGALVGELWNHT